MARRWGSEQGAVLAPSALGPPGSSSLPLWRVAMYTASRCQLRSIEAICACWASCTATAEAWAKPLRVERGAAPGCCPWGLAALEPLSGLPLPPSCALPRSPKGAVRSAQAPAMTVPKKTLQAGVGQVKAAHENAWGVANTKPQAGAGEGEIASPFAGRPQEQQPGHSLQAGGQRSRILGVRRRRRQLAQHGWVAGPPQAAQQLSMLLVWVGRAAGPRGLGDWRVASACGGCSRGMQALKPALGGPARVASSMLRCREAGPRGNLLQWHRVAAIHATAIRQAEALGSPQRGRRPDR